ncbi:MAG: CHASE domain-containing protein [Massilia sp.]|nr:CHASE domain-containing protein [Massilia sp.]
MRLAERYPGFRAIQFVRAVPGIELERFAADARRQADASGMPRFVVHPAV